MSGRSADVIGFVGGIGSGKSALAKWVAHRLGGIVLDADAAGHRALDRPEVRERIRKEIGSDVFDEQGAIVRKRLATHVFGGGEPEQAARRQLEQIVHPVIGQDLKQQIADAEHKTDLILLDAAVMLEAGWEGVCDALVYVDVPADVRQQRVQQTRGWSRDDLKQREASQWPLERKRAAADVVIDNSQSLETAGQQFLAWYQNWRGARHQS